MEAMSTYLFGAVITASLLYIGPLLAQILPSHTSVAFIHLREFHPSDWGKRPEAIRPSRKFLQTPGILAILPKCVIGILNVSEGSYI